MSAFLAEHHHLLHSFLQKYTYTVQMRQQQPIGRWELMKLFPLLLFPCGIAHSHSIDRHRSLLPPEWKIENNQHVSESVHVSRLSVALMCAVFAICIWACGERVRELTLNADHALKSLEQIDSTRSCSLYTRWKMCSIALFVPPRLMFIDVELLFRLYFVQRITLATYNESIFSIWPTCTIDINCTHLTEGGEI